MTRRAWLAWGGLGVVTMLAAASVWFALLNGEGSFGRVVVIGAGAVSLGGTGMLIYGRAGSVIGWLLWLPALAMALVQAVEGYGEYALLTEPGSIPVSAAVLALPQFVGAFLVAIPLIFLLFPTGHPPSPRWRAVAWALVVAGAMHSLGFGMRPGPLNGPWYDQGLRVRNPLGPDQVQVITNAMWVAGVAIALIAAAFSIASLVVRYRRAHGEERAQIRWLMLVALIALATFMLGQILNIALQLGVPVPDAAFDRVFMFLALDLLFGIPAACAIAILRYRLYDIDVVISKTVVYGGLAIAIGAVYVAVVAGVGEAIGTGTDSLALQIAATALIAIGFEPARSRLQRWANRLVYGKRAAPYEVMAGFGRRVAAVPSADDVLADMAEAARSGVGATAAQVTLFLDDRRIVARRPDGSDGDGSPTLVLPISYAGERIGELEAQAPANSPFRPAERALLNDLATHAGLALHNVRLAAELERRVAELASQTEELRDSRERIVSARDAQRRRLERELREGVGQQLATIGDQLEAEASSMGDEPSQVEDSLDELGVRYNSALEELRDVARGIFPPLLADRGLAAALEAHVRKIGLEATTRIDPVVAGTRYGPATENAVYFCCVQALQNAQRHGGGARVELQLDTKGDDLVFSVSDAGGGFEPSSTTGGEGMQIMRDRIAALDGTLVIDAAPSRGARVTGSVPITKEAVVA